MADRHCLPVGAPYGGSGPWVEIECPHCQMDFDIEPCQMDGQWECPHCRKVSRVGDVGELHIPSTSGEYLITFPRWHLTADPVAGVPIKFEWWQS